MKFNTEKDIQKALDTIFKEFDNSDRKIVHYPVMFKKAFVEYAQRHGVRIAPFAETFGLVGRTAYGWEQQYNDGLYNLAGTYAVSKTSKQINNSILKKLKQQVAEIQERIELIEKCESLGLKVTE